MNNSNATLTSGHSSQDSYGVVQIILAGATALFSLLGGMILVVLGTIKILSSELPIVTSNANFKIGILLVFICVLLLPFLRSKLFALKGKPPAYSISLNRNTERVLPLFALFIWIGTLLLGYFINWEEGWGTLAIPFISLLAVSLPLLFFVLVLGSQAKTLHPSRTWGALGAGAILGPSLSGLFEILIVLFLLVSIFSIRAQSPSFVSSLELLMIRLSAGEANPEIINHLAAAYLQNPVARGILYLFMAGLVPVIEEVIKQAPTWLLSWRKISASQGFMIGAYSGMGFALVEGLLNSLTIGSYDQFLLEIILRSGAGLIHITAGAICGWGLASAFDKQKYMNALVSYLAAVAIHGLWNTLSLWESTIRISKGIQNPTIPYYFANGYPGLLLFGFFIMMFCFWLVNRTCIKE